jgi:uncharacterized membrane protein
MPCDIRRRDKFFAILAYLSPFPFIIIPFFIVPLIFKRKHKWVNRHAKQGTVMFLLLLGFGWIPVFGWLLTAVYLICWPVELISVVRGRFFKIPIAGAIGDALDI